MYAIYGLVDPRDRKVFYVGQTTDVYKRFIEHINCASNNLARNARIIELRALNLMVIMEVLELVEDKLEANDREAYWVKHFDQTQHPLTNIALMPFPKRARREQVKMARSTAIQITKRESNALALEQKRDLAEIEKSLIDPNSVKIGVNLITKHAVTITKEQFHTLLLKRKNGKLRGHRQIMEIMPALSETHARNLNSMLLKELGQSQEVLNIDIGRKL